MTTTYDKCKTCRFPYPPKSPLRYSKYCSRACKRKGQTPTETKKSGKNSKTENGGTEAPTETGS